jgi:hypothetical protein
VAAAAWQLLQLALSRVWLAIEHGTAVVPRSGREKTAELAWLT